MSTPPPPVHPAPAARTILGLAGRLVVVLAALAALLFLPAGTWNWLEGWVFVVAFGTCLVLYAGWGLLKDPEQLKERGRVAANVKPWDKLILAAYTLCVYALLFLAGLDAGRFHWSQVPLAMEALAWLGLAAAGALIFWALATNTYLSRMARIQDDRGQVVVSGGPYHYVRHPMYSGIIVLFLCVPLALGSAWALLPGGTIGVLFVVRTAKEDRMLRDELAGYEAYAARVRWRLLPGVW